MTVANPDFLHVFNETSGRAITNYGSKAGAFAIATQAVESTNFSWHQGLGPYTSSGYLQLLSASGSQMPYLSTSFTAPSQALVNLNVAVGFRVTAYNNGNLRLVMPGSNTSDGNVLFEAQTPAGAGDYDFIMRFRNTGGGEIAGGTVSALAFGTDYIVAASVDVGTVTAVQGRFKFGANSVVSPATANWTSFACEAAWPFVLRRSDFTNYYGMQGRLNFFAYQRNATAWVSQDLIDIVANPATAITGWPSGGNAPITRASRAGSGGIGPEMNGGMSAGNGILVPHRKIYLPARLRHHELRAP